MIKLCPKVPEKDLLNVFVKLQKDEQDSVRMHGVESCILFAQKLSPTMATTHLVPIIQNFAEDKSWRIRYVVADRILDLANELT
jgi:serine/threonine-protein phosphatase 2A regulatory subunit A